MSKLDDLHGKLLKSPKAKKLDWRELPDMAALVSDKNHRAVFRGASRVKGRDAISVVWLEPWGRLGDVESFAPNVFGKIFRYKGYAYGIEDVPMEYAEFHKIVVNSGKLKGIRGWYNDGQGSVDPDTDPEGTAGHDAGIEAAMLFIHEHIPAAARGATMRNVGELMNDIGS
jgi:hypothetical protein